MPPTEFVPVVTVDGESPFLGQTCALCKQEFNQGATIVVCPADGSRHHIYCWQANNNHCTAYGCEGAGMPGRQPRGRPRPVARQQQQPPIILPGAPGQPASKVRVLPSNTFGCLRTCFVIALIVVILVGLFGCFALWNVIDSVTQTGALYLEPGALSSWLTRLVPVSLIL